MFLPYILLQQPLLNYDCLCLPENMLIFVFYWVFELKFHHKKGLKTIVTTVIAIKYKYGTYFWYLLLAVYIYEKDPFLWLLSSGIKSIIIVYFYHGKIGKTDKYM